MSTPHVAGTQAGPRRGSVRLTFAYDEAGLRLKDRLRRRKSAPPSAPLDREPPPNAVILELRSRTDEVLYRRVLNDPIPQDAEVVDPDGRLRRVAFARPTGVFTVVVPRTGAEIVVVVSAGPEVVLAQAGLAPPPGGARVRRELLRLELEPD